MIEAIVKSKIERMAMAAVNSISSAGFMRFSADTRTSVTHPHIRQSISLHNLQKKALALHLFSLPSKSISMLPSAIRPRTIASQAPTEADRKIFHGQCFVVGDNIDTDQIIPAEYLTLVPSKPEEYEKLGSYAMFGLPAKYGRFIEDGETKTKYSVLIGGANFGCGSSREHAPVALGAAGVKTVVAESYARIFFRNSVATGEVYPLESETRICEECQTGHIVTVELEGNKLINHTTGKEYALKPIGDAGPVIDAGGIFAYARKTGMISAPPS